MVCRRGADLQRVRPVLLHAPSARRSSAEETPLRLQRLRQSLPLPHGAGTPQGRVPALVRQLLLSLRGVVRLRGVPRGPPPAALMHTPHYCREAPQLGHVCLR